MSKAAWCDICNVQLSSESLLSEHSKGKRHQKKSAEREALLALASRSVFLSGFDPEISVTDEEIAEALSCFGKVEKVQLDTRKKTFAFVEFSDEFSAQRAIFEDKLRIGYQTVLVRARKVDFNQAQSKPQEQSIVVSKIIHRINQTSFVSQVDALISFYCLTDAQVSERSSYEQLLTNALGQYFSSGAHVRIFGSSITSIGTKDSDVIAETLSCFGKVEKVQLDTRKKTFAFVEFSDEFSAQRAIFEDKLRIGYQTVLVRARKVDFNQAQSKPQEQSIVVSKIIRRINQPSFISQVDALINLYCLTDAQVSERSSYEQLLTNALGQYFSSGAHVRIFGSSITSIGTKDSDIVCFSFWARSYLSLKTVLFTFFDCLKSV
ncbi:unnamed protein product [Gongylonema pulchrum]|uniref:RRM domain-containing protein n=1 Tax=Gongylonema pulchrum TaxID=637853 RepID=A0A183E2R4_9BILA|nr:unnamed protein product [Gongylonema pulchrum]